MTGALMIVSFAINSIHPPGPRWRGHGVSIGLEKFDQSGCYFIRPLVRDIVAAPRDRAACHIGGKLLEHRHHLRTKSLVPTQAKHRHLERVLLVPERSRMIGGKGAVP